MVAICEQLQGGPGQEGVAVSALHESLAASHPKLRRGQVWCRKCRAAQSVNSAGALRHGWPKCCGFTMTIDPPEEW